jgi:hypothetical protein
LPSFIFVWFFLFFSAPSKQLFFFFNWTRFGTIAVFSGKGVSGLFEISSILERTPLLAVYCVSPNAPRIHHSSTH